MSSVIKTEEKSTPTTHAPNKEEDQVRKEMEGVEVEKRILEKKEKTGDRAAPVVVAANLS